jgi:hypothetical protein
MSRDEIHYPTDRCIIMNCNLAYASHKDVILSEAKDLARIGIHLSKQKVMHFRRPQKALPAFLLRPLAARRQNFT